MYFRKLFRCSFLLSVVLLVQFLPVRSQVLIVNSTVIDIENKKLLPGMDVMIEDQVITAIGSKLPVPSGSIVVDGSGKYLIPGFVDAHVHFFQSGGIYTRPDVIDLRKFKPYSEEISWTHSHMENTLRRYARAGITTVIDPGSTINFLIQRDSFRIKDYAPTIYMTGPLLVTYDFSGYENLVNDNPFYYMNSVEDPYHHIRKQYPYKPDFIKIGFVVPGRNKDSVARSYLPRVRAAIEEAHKLGLRVAVHAFEETTARLAVEAGANHLVHIPFDVPIGSEFIQILKDNDVVLSSSTTVFAGDRKIFGQYYRPTKDDSIYAHPDPIQSLVEFKDLPDTALTESLRRSTLRNAPFAKKMDSLLLVNLKILVDAGVPVATSTDAGNIGVLHVSSYFKELANMQKGGLDMWQLLESSTINGARALGKEDEFGSVATGKRADMVLLNSNPLDHLDNWKDIDCVILKGVVWKPEELLND